MNKLTLLKLESNHKEYPHTALLIISLEIFPTKIFLLHTDPQVVYCNCVLTRNIDKAPDRKTG